MSDVRREVRQIDQQKWTDTGEQVRRSICSDDWYLLIAFGRLLGRRSSRKSIKFRWKSRDSLDQFTSRCCDPIVATIRCYLRATLPSRSENNDSRTQRKSIGSVCAAAKPLFISSLASCLALHHRFFEKFGSQKYIPLSSSNYIPRETSPTDPRGDTWLWRNYFDPRWGLFYAQNLSLAYVLSSNSSGKQGVNGAREVGVDCSGNFTLTERERERKRERDRMARSTKQWRVTTCWSKRRLPPLFPIKSNIVNRSSEATMGLFAAKSGRPWDQWNSCRSRSRVRRFFFSSRGNNVSLTSIEADLIAGEIKIANGEFAPDLFADDRKMQNICCEYVYSTLHHVRINVENAKTMLASSEIVLVVLAYQERINFVIISGLGFSRLFC